MAVRVDSVESPKNYFLTGRYDDAWQALQDHKNIPGSEGFFAELLQCAIDQGNDLLDVGLQKDLPNQRRWVLKAMLCRQIAFHAMRALPNERAYDDSYQQLCLRIQLSPTYAAWEQDCQQMLLASGLSNNLGIQAASKPTPSTFINKIGKLVFSQKNTSVKLSFVPYHVHVYAQSDGRRGGVPLGDERIFYFRGKMEEIPLAKRIEIFELLQRYSEPNPDQLWRLKSCYVQSYRDSTGRQEIDSVDNFIEMLNFQLGEK